ncbi:MAG: hypothetical protein HPY64_05465 [Anaerolineae bacterium]|nr:hypothetical protein [Anaerolineae bacterium]
MVLRWSGTLEWLHSRGRVPRRLKPSVIRWRPRWRPRRWFERRPLRGLSRRLDALTIKGL